MSTKAAKLLLLTTTAVGGFVAYKYFYQNGLVFSNSKENIEDCAEHALLIIKEEKMRELVEDLKIQLVPYYHHYFNLLREMEKEYVLRYKERDDPSKDTKGLRSKTLYELKAKVRKELDAK